jgi:hypothetical protein
MWSANATNNFFILQNLTTCFGPYGPSSSDTFLKILTLLQHIHNFYKCEAIYCFLICMYTMLRKFKIHNFYIGLHNAYKFSYIFMCNLCKKIYMHLM